MNLLVHSLLNRNSYSNCHTNHRVVAGAQEAHHFYVCRNGGRTSELRIGMHTAKSIGHTIGSRTSCHVVRMQCTACAATGSY